MAPIVHGLEAKYGDQVNFIYLDIEDPATKSFQRELGYRSQPHYFLLNEEGRTVKEWRGFVSEEEFEEAIQAELE